MSKDGLIYGFTIDSEQNVQELNYDDLKKLDKQLNKTNLTWLHFDYTNEKSIKWITENSTIHKVAIDALLIEDTRPRTTILEDSILLTLRGINLNPNSLSEDMVSVRLYISENLIISTQRRSLLSIDDLANSLRKNKTPINASEFIIYLTTKLISRIDDNMEDIEDKAIEIEEQSLDSSNMEFKTKMSSLKRELISLKKYLYPQKEAMKKLYYNNISWIKEYQKIQLREINERLILNIEELETSIEKLSLIQEEFRCRE
ncbi:MAG: zinc transporter ZntB [Arcobacter sp.]|nr:MAG: zinc transporter ZntB [Arcobacter sp.]